MEQASEILRRYIESRFAIRSTRQTTREFLAGLNDTGQHNPLAPYRPELRACLEQADMAKFAHLVPDSGIVAQMERAVTDFVNKTEPHRRPEANHEISASGDAPGFLPCCPCSPFCTAGRGRRRQWSSPPRPLLRLWPGQEKLRPGNILLLLRLGVLALLILALAGPQLGSSTTEIKASGIDILLAVDVSGSMEAMDFTLDGKPANRLAVVKKVVDEFIEQRPNDRIGLLAFAGRPYLVSPLTLDHEWLRKRLESIEIGMVEDGTAIGSAIGSGTNRLRDQKSKSRLLILLTDGMNNAGSVPPADGRRGGGNPGHQGLYHRRRHPRRGAPCR